MWAKLAASSLMFIRKNYGKMFCEKVATFTSEHKIFCNYSRFSDLTVFTNMVIKPLKLQVYSTKKINRSWVKNSIAMQSVATLFLVIFSRKHCQYCESQPHIKIHYCTPQEKNLFSDCSSPDKKYLPENLINFFITVLCE